MSTGYPETTEAELVTLAIAGDAEAFGDLYERYLTPIFQYIYYRVSNHAEAEDLTEIVFLKAWEALPGYRLGKAPFQAWLYRIAHNIVIDHYRTRKEQVAIDEQPLAAGEAYLPESQAIELEQSNRLLAAVAQLDEAYQEVLTLRFLNELSHAEVAEIMDRSEGAVRVLQHRALNALRDCLAEG